MFDYSKRAAGHWSDKNAVITAGGAKDMKGPLDDELPVSHRLFEQYQTAGVSIMYNEFFNRDRSWRMLLYNLPRLTRCSHGDIRSSV